MSKEESIRLVQEHSIKHIAYIMDGNGRWAQRRGMPREYGHKIGRDAFRRIVDYTLEIGVQHITVYAFSTENWKRSAGEVAALMKLFIAQMRTAKKDLDVRDLRVVFLGDKGAFNPIMANRMNNLEKYSKDYHRVLNVAMNYGSRAEIVHAVNVLLSQGKKKATEADLTANLYTSLSPDPDLIVRTAGEERLSNFLLWQAAYSEFYFTDTLWPDMSEEDVDRAIKEFARRTRRYGAVV